MKCFSCPNCTGAYGSACSDWKWLKDKESTGQGVEGGGEIPPTAPLQNPAWAAGSVLCCRKDTGLEWTLLFSAAVSPVHNCLFLSLFSSLMLLWLCLVCPMLLRHLNGQNNLLLFSL